MMLMATTGRINWDQELLPDRGAAGRSDYPGAGSWEHMASAVSVSGATGTICERHIATGAAQECGRWYSPQFLIVLHEVRVYWPQQESIHN